MWELGGCDRVLVPFRQQGQQGQKGASVHCPGALEDVGMSVVMPSPRLSTRGTTRLSAHAGPVLMLTCALCLSTGL